ncbi:MAG: ABC transporter permease [Candidatus Omnitrophica bacterium]|nr:ABC transporter permease [Candidatus Omnitrophota bacterium]MBU4488591.1 ABC transporter permease [Candidatus Omnitrophota bacterium]MCG2704471.1 ABC transporter permease [Candidatus Omnitrophota bacterium]
MNNILSIASITYKEALRNRLLNTLIIFAAVSIASTRFFVVFAPSEELKIIQDTSLGIIRFMGMLITVFLTAALLPREMERRTVTTVITKAVSRTEFLFGKFLGAVYAIMANMVFMSLILFIIIYLKGKTFNPELIKALFLMSIEFIVLGSITLCISTIASEMFNITFGILIFLVGHLTNYLNHLAEKFTSVGMKSLLITLYTLLPNFENFNIQDAIVLGAKVSLAYIGKAASYGLIYSVIMLLLGYLLFAEREI